MSSSHYPVQPIRLNISSSTLHCGVTSAANRAAGRQGYQYLELSFLREDEGVLKGETRRLLSISGPQEVAPAPDAVPHGVDKCLV